MKPRYLTLFRSAASTCLDDAPSASIERPKMSVEFSSSLPGVILDADKQCELQGGISMKKCSAMQVYSRMKTLLFLVFCYSFDFTYRSLFCNGTNVEQQETEA